MCTCVRANREQSTAGAIGELQGCCGILIYLSMASQCVMMKSVCARGNRFYRLALLPTPTTYYCIDSAVLRAGWMARQVCVVINALHCHTGLLLYIRKQGDTDRSHQPNPPSWRRYQTQPSQPTCSRSVRTGRSILASLRVTLL